MANLASQDVKVDSFTFTQDPSSGNITFFIMVTNTGGTARNRSVNVAIQQSQGISSPNLPYPSRQTPTGNPVPTNSESVTLAPGETKTVTVIVSTPSGLTIEPANVVITVM